MNEQSQGANNNLQHLEAVNRWKKRIQEHKESGLTQTEWCRENCVSISSFSVWKRRLIEEEQCVTNDLVDISFAMEESPSAGYNIQRRICEQPVAATIEFPQYKVHVYEGASSDVLKNIMEAMAHA